VTDTLLGLVLERLDLLEAPVYSHREASAFPAELERLRREGVLVEGAGASEVRGPGGTYLEVRRTAVGLYGVAAGDSYVKPVPLSEDDVREYEVSLPKLAEKLRRECGISGAGFCSDGGLVALGQKETGGFGLVQVYLSVPNIDEDALLSRCRRARPKAEGGKAVVLVPRGAALSPEVRDELESLGVMVVPLQPHLADGAFALRLDALLGLPAIDKDTCILQRQGKKWRIVFDGKESYVDHSNGVRYIAELLRQPDKALSAADLRDALSGRQKHWTSPGMKESDKKALLDYRRRYEEIIEGLEEARRNNDIGRAQLFEEEKSRLTVEIKTTQGLGGRGRKLGDDVKRARTTVCNAIDRAMSGIEKAHPALWAHLKSCLHPGATPIYQPGRAMAWAVST